MLKGVSTVATTLYLPLVVNACSTDVPTAYVPSGNDHRTYSQPENVRPTGSRRNPTSSDVGQRLNGLQPVAFPAPVSVVFASVDAMHDGGVVEVMRMDPSIRSRPWSADSTTASVAAPSER